MVLSGSNRPVRMGNPPVEGPVGAIGESGKAKTRLHLIFEVENDEAEAQTWDDAALFGPVARALSFMGARGARLNGMTTDSLEVADED